MKRLEVYWLGFLVKEIDIFISGDLRHIEITESWKLLGLTLRETSREAYIPNVNLRDTQGLQVIAEAYLGLRDVAEKLKEELTD